jgi:hypothetical protein
MAENLAPNWEPNNPYAGASSVLKVLSQRPLMRFMRPENRRPMAQAKWLNGQEFVIVGPDPERSRPYLRRCCWATIL